MLAAVGPPYSMKPVRLFILLAGGLFMIARLTAATADRPPAAREAVQHVLDFWVGEWEVYDNASHQLDGHNRIEKVLKGEAIIEHWSDANGSAGKSWFYFYRPENRWKQVWVTDDGGVKEKAQVADAPAGSVRFRGEIPLPDKHKLLDQTTLTLLPDGRVRQVIEQSRDGGITWHTVYDANYIRHVPHLS